MAAISIAEIPFPSLLPIYIHTLLLHTHAPYHKKVLSFPLPRRAKSVSGLLSFSALFLSLSQSQREVETSKCTPGRRESARACQSNFPPPLCTLSRRKRAKEFERRAEHSLLADRDGFIFPKFNSRWNPRTCARVRLRARMWVYVRVFSYGRGDEIVIKRFSKERACFFYISKPRQRGDITEARSILRSTI